MVGKYLIEKIARIPVEVVIGSEFRYSDPIVDENTVVLAISQSGETADTLAAMEEGRRKGRHHLEHRQCHWLASHARFGWIHLDANRT
jgi:glucosamine 6-phosphate synthetase-like amidotransferase/phosphosugar isomerase protein